MTPRSIRRASPLAALVPSPDGLLFADGATVVRIADEVEAPTPPGSFRAAEGDPIYVAEGGDVFRLRAMALERVASTGEPDDMKVEAHGLRDGRVVIALGIGPAREMSVPGAWHGVRSWRAIRVTGSTILAAAPDGLVIADASTGLGSTTPLGREPVPIGRFGDRVWFHTHDAALLGSPDGRIELAHPRPRIALDGASAAVMTGALVAEEVDLAAAVVRHRVDLSALTSSAQPLAFAAGRLVFRDREQGVYHVELATGAVTQIPATAPRAAGFDRDRLYLIDGDHLWHVEGDR